MALFVLHLPPPPLSPHPPNPNPNPNPNPRRRPSLHLRTFPLPRARWRGATAPRSSLGSAPSPSPSPSVGGDALRRGAAALVLHLAASIFVLLGFGARASALAPATPPLPSPAPAAAASETDHAVENSDTPQAAEDEEWSAAFETWKAKIYELTVPLRIVALRGSIPPSWTKDFIQAQGRRLKLILEYRGSLDSIFSELCLASEKGRVQPKSAMASDIVSIGDSWLSYAVRKGLIEPIKDAEEHDWFRNLSEKWKVYLCRNSKGELDSSGDIWGAPYRWGTMVIAYKKSKFRKHNLKPIEDWEDLWRPELAGKIAMVDSPREVVGAVLKRLGASYNTKDIDLQVNGGREEVLKSLRALQRQVRLFDNVYYLKSFGIGDVWVAVGWSSDVIPAAKRMSNVAVIVPKSGTSLWADLWAIPYATKFNTDQIGGRVRGPSPLIHQWFEFCLQTARALPFRQEVVPGSSPFTVEHPQLEGPREPDKGKPKLDTNLVGGVPPAETLAKCEFLEPLSDKALEDHQWLISNTVKRNVV
ncbi:Spermidine-binding periplasmic protein SpuE [Ananas comosus]|uniref:Spermidine-binding periplasmic protein SpuE n=1 Tax=Ananas comosus TaxID=4615 RepID=A0A199VLH4_ANACO|nr:Spermidine-binding periplasmic protein SpuE [Ananas comosus]